jgi:hypothetical protein
MARIDKGNALSTAMLQPGAKFGSDGYGLVTGVATFKEDSNGSSAFLARGSSCTVPGFTFCTVHKATTSVDALGINTYTVDYVGIGSGGVSSTQTKPQITGSQGLTAEHITTHPNFYKLATGFSGSPIAGLGTGGTEDIPKFAPVTGTTPVEYEGNNGATFELAIGRKFLGFKKAKYPTLYGKTNYLSPQSSISGIFYTSSEGTTITLRNAVGKTSQTGTFAGFALTPAYMGTSFSNGSLHQLLLSQISFEDFGTLFKIQYELRFNREGYNASVYAPA